VALELAVEGRLRNGWMLRPANIGLSRVMAVWILCVAIFDHTVLMGTERERQQDIYSDTSANE
jgi:hypothetical protein